MDAIFEAPETVRNSEVANNESESDLLDTEKSTSRKEKRKPKKKVVENNGPQIRDQKDDKLEAPGTVRNCEVSNNELTSDLRDTEKSTSRKKKRIPKNKAVENNGPEGRDQKDDNLEAPETVRKCKVTNNESTSDLFDTEKSISRKKKRKPKKKAVENNGPQIRDQTDDNLENPDTLRTCDVANNESKTDILKIETSKRRKKKRKPKKKALEKNGSQIMDQMDDNLEAPEIVRDIEVTNDESKQNPLETDLTDQQMAVQPSKDKDSSGDLSNGNSIRKKKRG